ncbi:MAG: DNA-binding transcriptional regulator [Planctomycetia bacterium]|nr:DNA-binding transcriptional regulator [Planctomycetia bacterium]
MPDAPLVAVILDAARPYDRLIIGGVARYVREQAPSWSLYVEEDPLEKLPDLKRWHGDGIIANFDDRRVAAALRDLKLPIVGVGGGYGWFDPASGIPYVFTDNRAIGRLGAAHLLACGFAEFAFYGSPRTSTDGWSKERAVGFEAACREAGRPCHIHTGRQTTARRWQELQRDLRAWIAKLPKPIGLMACNDVRARHVLEACRTLGLRVPDDVAVLGVDNDEMICELTSPPLSSIDQAARQIGYEAATLLGRMLSRGRSAARSARVVVPPIGVVPRMSTDTMATTDDAVAHTLHALRSRQLQRPDITALAEEVCLSRPGLEARFRAVVGRSIHDESVRIRVAAIRRLITQTDLPLKAISARAGFGSVQYMTTFLHRHTGTTPARLRLLERSPANPAAETVPASDPFSRGQ